MITKEQIKRIYALGAGLGLVDSQNHDGDLLHALVAGITGKSSVSELSEIEFKSIEHELINRMRLSNQTAPLKAKKSKAKAVPEPPTAGMMTAAQGNLAWRMIYRLKELDNTPSSATVSERMQGAIAKILGITPNMSAPFKWVNFDSGEKLIETLKRYVRSAERKADKKAGVAENVGTG